MRIALAVVLLASGSNARADDFIPGHRVDHSIDGGIAAASFTAAAVLQLAPVRDSGPLWTTQLFGDADRSVYGTFSPRAAHIADATLGISVLAPALYLTGGSPMDDAAGDRLLIYSETMGVNALLGQTVKFLVQRPRPYLYNQSAAARAYATAHGDDGHLSFYSAHAATSFCAAVAGAYLLSTETTSTAARAAAWGGGMFLAAATANLRVRGGKHFYSDVVIGAAIGGTVGYLVPALHATGAPNGPSATDVTFALVGLFGGAVASEILPLGDSQVEPRGKLARFAQRTNLRLAPIPIEHGAGFGIGGVLR